MFLISSGRDRKLEVDRAVSATRFLAVTTVFSMSMLPGSEWHAAASPLGVVDMMTIQL
jgi:hypothetical protein